MKTLFYESQRFTQWWVWIIIIGCGIPFAIGIVQQVFLGKTFGDNPMSNTGLITGFILYVAFTVLFFLLKLETSITEQGISFRFFPFVSKKVLFSEIENMEVINYGFVGGWGIRFTMKYGTVYNIRGNMGVLVKLKKGKTFIIGTQQPNVLKNSIVSLQNKSL